MSGYRIKQFAEKAKMRKKSELLMEEISRLDLPPRPPQDEEARAAINEKIKNLSGLADEMEKARDSMRKEIANAYKELAENASPFHIGQIVHLPYMVNGCRRAFVTRIHSLLYSKGKYGVSLWPITKNGRCMIGDYEIHERSNAAETSRLEKINFR
jgi:hypothetical protein